MLLKKPIPFCLCLLLSLAPGVVLTHMSAGQRPNILFILMNDLGYGDLTCYNLDSDTATPQVDSITDEGIHFTQYYSAEPSGSLLPSYRPDGANPGRLRPHDLI